MKDQYSQKNQFESNIKNLRLKIAVLNREKNTLFDKNQASGCVSEKLENEKIQEINEKCSFDY